MSWDKMKREEAGNGLFVKLKDGESVEGIFMGEPYTFYQIFKDKTEYANWVEGASFKFRVNFITKDDSGKLVSKIFQGGSKVAGMIADAKEEYGLNCVYKIKRTGSGKDDTRYAVLFKEKLTGEKEKTIKTIPLIPLTKQKDVVDMAKEAFGMDDHEEAPF